LPRLYAGQLIDVQDFSFLKGKNAFTIIQNLIAGKSTPVCAEIDSRMEANNEASRKLQLLQRTDKFLFEERGSKDLHVGWPFVHGKFNDGTLIRCPLIFFPVELVLENGQWFLQPRPGVDASFNKTFLLAYAHYNKVSTSEELMEEDFDEFNRDPTVFRSELYQLLQKHNFEVNFNPDNFRDELIPFTAYKKEELASKLGNGQLKLFPEAVVGIFPQAGSSLVPDYNDLIENERIKDLEDFFYQRSAKNTAPQTNYLPEVREEKVYSVFPMDAWQENALKGAKLGHSMVVQGPPGTGKSQLICNMISDMIANEKRVLVVCQKRVAIDVVYNRLREKRLDDFVALVHDFRDDRKVLYEKAARQIDRVDEYKFKNNSLDSIQIERKFFEVSRRIDQLSEELEAFRKTLFDDSDSGLSIKEMYLLSDPSQPAVDLKQDLSYFPWPAVDPFKRKVRTYTRLAKRFLDKDYPLRLRKSFSEWTIKDLKIARSIFKEAHKWFADVRSKMTHIMGQSLDWEQCEICADREQQLTELIDLLSSIHVYENFVNIVQQPEGDASPLWLANMEKLMVECFDDEGPELTIPTQQLGQLQQSLYRSMKSRRSLIGLVRWELFSKDKFLVTRILVNNNLKSNIQGFKILERKLDRRLNLEHNLTKLRAVPWIKSLPGYQNADQLRDWFAFQQAAMTARSHFQSLRGLPSILDPQHLRSNEMVTKLAALREILHYFPAQKAKWIEWLLPIQIRMLVDHKDIGPLWEKTISNDFDELVDFDRINETLLPHEKQIIDKLHDLIGDWDEQQVENTLINSLCLSWIEHMEIKHPELRIVSTGKMESLEAELLEKIEAKEVIGSEILLMRARERMTDNLEFNRLNNRVSYRDLNHQLTKKKKIWPIRKLVNEFEDEIFKLLPCWMASPEAVSSIFPMKELFDIVIFDEASQCFAERGIPSLYRGRQVVIAGDSQQLQPFDLYQSRWEEESNDDPDEESTSLLDLGSRYLQEVGLHGHYRSQLPELIQFSNQHFYKGKLRLLPDRNRINDREPAIEYIKVKGQWVNNTNKEEASEVVSLVRSISKAHPGKEIGVITFNAPQQELIQDYLDTAADESWKAPPSLFVKNIENVQGDEKDIIIFSIGYAKDKSGKLKAQFGSLNLVGGENRLNVAVTRARQKIIVVASIDPEDLKVEDTVNKGPKLLRAYLEYASETSSRKGPAQSFEVDRHPASWYLKRVVKNELPMGVALEGNLPYCDFMVKRDNEYSVLLLTDDDHYFESPSAKSAHALVPRSFQERNWKFKMLYSRNYWANREKFWLDIRRQLNS
jgi:hypothetical protein